tara:strand:+ start:17 stop:994 length:978 start_codon:yes stop_codon:yes gene_type:complete
MFLFLGRFMEFKDYYKILGVSKNADVKDIKTAYRKLARKYHPDLNSEEGVGEKFKEVAEAYEVLKDSGRRAKFDELLEYGDQSSQGFQPPPGWQQNSHAYQGDPAADQHFSDFFNSIFSGGFDQSHFNGQAQQHHSRGQDVETELAISLQETLHQHIKTVHYQLPVSEGGQIRQIKKQLNIKIPQGVINGERIRLKGQGKPGYNGGESGDLYLHIRVNSHPLFDVKKLDLILTLPLAPWEAALGTKVTVPTLDGKVTLTIAANSQSGKKLRVKGKGLKRKDKLGDLYVIINVIIPPFSNDKTNQLWQELAKNSAFDPRVSWGEYL